jgi:lipopolysaccharide export system protein LptA
VVSDSVCIRSPDAIVHADSAVYFLDARLIELFGRVRVEMDSLTITAPHLLYLVGDQRIDADDGMTVFARGDGTRLRGARGRYFIDRKVGEVDSLPVLELRSQSADSHPVSDGVTATARAMMWYGADETTLLAGDVRVGTGTSALTADSLRYWTQADTGVAWGGPRIADSASSTGGDTIRLAVRGGALRLVEVVGGASGQYRAAGSSDVEVSGEVIRIRFEQGELDVVEVERMTRGWLVQRGGPGS